MSGVTKAAHVKLQNYINSLIPEVDRPHSIIFDILEAYERYQTRTIALENGGDYIQVSTDVDYTGYVHQTDDNETEPGCAHIPGKGIKHYMNHRILSLEDDREQFINLRHSLEPTKPMDWVFEDEQS